MSEQSETFATPDFKSIVLFKFMHAFKRAGKQIDLGACANLNRTTDLKSGVQEFYHFLQHRRQKPKVWRGFFNWPKNVVSKSIFGLVTVNKYHNESVCGRLSCRKPYSRIMLSGVAGSGKTPVKWLEDVWPVIYGVITKSDNTYIYRYTSSYSILTQWYYYHHLQYIVLSLV